MAHRTFFSFHYQLDVWRAAVVRESSQVEPRVQPEWIEAAIWEKARAHGDGAVLKLINRALTGTTVTAVLIGSRTASRRWVKYEIDKSLERGNGLFGIYLHNIKDDHGRTAARGANPLPAGYRTYDWVDDDGHDNLGSWVDLAYAEHHRFANRYEGGRSFGG